MVKIKEIQKESVKGSIVARKRDSLRQSLRDLLQTALTEPESMKIIVFLYEIQAFLKQLVFQVDPKEDANVYETF